ncbi:MAG: HU family DNA-binding protein [Desulfovibrio sp.]
MNKAELIDMLNEGGMTKSEAKAAVDSVLDAIVGAIANGEKITLTGFGTFEVVDTPARTGRNPQTGEAVQIPAGKRIKFKPGKQLKEAVR